MRIILFLIMAYQIGFGQWQLIEQGRFGGTGNAAGEFREPSALDFSGDGRLFVCDRGNNRIQVFSDRGKYLDDIGGFGWQKEQFDAPQDIWARSTINIWVADYNNQRVQRLDKDLNFLGSLESNSAEDERFQFREVLSAAYSAQGDLFLLDNGERKVVKFNPRRNAELAFGYYESGEGELQDPRQVELTARQHVLVTDAGLPGLVEFDYFGTFIRSISHPHFKQPAGLAVDGQGRIWIADPGAKTVFVLDERGAVLAEFTSCSGQMLRQPRDVALRKNKSGQQMVYLIDGDQIIIAKLNDPGDRE